MGVPLLFKACVKRAIERKSIVLCEVDVNEVLTVVSDWMFFRVDVGHVTKTAHDSWGTHKSKYGV